MKQTKPYPAHSAELGHSFETRQTAVFGSETAKRCTKCGQVKDNPDVLRKAAKYLEEA